jgi:hypothetical protein
VASTDPLFKGKPGLKETLFQMDLQEATFRQTPIVASPDPFMKGKPALKETLFQMDLQEATSRQTPGVLTSPLY